ncbi:MAG: hypothetical protein RBR40_06420 [Tenuifilaceae bacterium]|jgi:hypothetical protein|nr:hypothetical protein [Tenuifilaceae bacterium]
MKDFEKKIRIQLFDEEMNQLSDRLLGQDLELRMGPKNTHKGPLKVEACLFTVDDLVLFRDYLDRISGELPLTQAKKRGRKKTKMVETEGFGEVLAKELSNITTGSDFYKFLEDNDFVFSNYQLLVDLGLPVKLPEEFQDPEDYRILIRRIKKAKNPLNSKYDPTLILALERTNSTVVLGFNMSEEVLRLELDSLKVSKIKVSRSNLTKFPGFMTLEERNRFRIDRDNLIKNPDAKPTRFYSRWVHPIADINSGIEFPRIDEIEKPY